MDLNADLGESFGTWRLGDDERLVAHITSANVACGFHAGDFRVMEATVALCRRAGVAVGAQPGYPDLHGLRSAAAATSSPTRSSRWCDTRSVRSRRSVAPTAWRCSTSSRTAPSTTRRRPILRWRRRSPAPWPASAATSPLFGLASSEPMAAAAADARIALRARGLRRPSLHGRWHAPASIRAGIGHHRSGHRRRPGGSDRHRGRPRRPPTDRTLTSAPRASAATATRRVRSRSPPRCAAGWSTPA